MLPLLRYALLALLPLSLYLLIRALKGKPTDDHPRCARCNYDLSGTPPDSKLCSECGAPLDQQDAIRRGQRRRLYGQAALALLLAAAAVLASQAIKNHIKTVESRPYVLMQAIRASNLQTIDDLLKKDLRLANAVVFNKSMLQAAVEDADYRVVKKLLDAKANPRAPLREQTADTLLHRAAKYADPNSLQLLLEAGLDPNTKGENGNTPLHEAATRRWGGAKVPILLEAAANPNVANDQGITALHYAAATGDIPTIKALLAAGAHLNPLDNKGQTPLHTAAAWGRLQAAYFLLDAGADITATDLRYALQRNLPADLWWHKLDKLYTANQLDEISALLKKQPSALQLTSRAGTLLHRAILHKRDPLIKLLLDLGVDPNTTDDQGQTALHAAITTLDNDAPKIVQLLLQHKANPQTPDHTGATPLDLALRYKRDPKTIALLK